jgi:hypothetical protein
MEIRPNDNTSFQFARDWMLLNIRNSNGTSLPQIEMAADIGVRIRANAGGTPQAPMWPLLSLRADQGILLESGAHWQDSAAQRPTIRLRSTDGLSLTGQRIGLAGVAEFSTPVAQIPASPVDGQAWMADGKLLFRTGGQTVDITAGGGGGGSDPNAVQRTGDTMTGPLTVPRIIGNEGGDLILDAGNVLPTGDVRLSAGTYLFTDALAPESGNEIAVDGNLSISDPQAPEHAATKAYVDGLVFSEVEVTARTEVATWNPAGGSINAVRIGDMVFVSGNLQAGAAGSIPAGSASRKPLLDITPHPMDAVKFCTLHLTPAAGGPSVAIHGRINNLPGSTLQVFSNVAVTVNANDFLTFMFAYKAWPL